MLRCLRGTGRARGPQYAVERLSWHSLLVEEKGEKVEIELWSGVGANVMVDGSDLLTWWLCGVVLRWWALADGPGTTQS